MSTEPEQQSTDRESPDQQDSDTLLLIDDHEEEVSVGGRKVRRRGVYLLPNLFTTGALFAGFYAVIAGMQGLFAEAAIAIYVAMVLDGLDGRVARMTRTQSRFGEQYDSLSDMVSFGVAPAMVMFSWALAGLGKFGWAIAFIYMACAALRLARFNSQIETTDKKFFTGLASPSAAAVIAGMVWVCYERGLVGEGLPVELAALAAVFTAAIALLMIVNIRYYSFKGVDLRGRVPFVVIIAVVLVFGLVTLDPPLVLLAAALIYAASGPVQAIYRRVGVARGQ